MRVQPLTGIIQGLVISKRWLVVDMQISAELQSQQNLWQAALLNSVTCAQRIIAVQIKRLAGERRVNWGYTANFYPWLNVEDIFSLHFHTVFAFLLRSYNPECCSLII